MFEMYTNKMPSVTTVEDSYTESLVVIWNWLQKTWNNAAFKHACCTCHITVVYARLFEWRSVWCL